MNPLLKSITIAVLASALPFATIAATASKPTPIPALMSSKAAHGLLLGLARTAKAYVAVGGNGVILRWDDGEQWMQVQSPVDTALTQVSFAGESQMGWAVGHDGVILKTADGGKTWVLQKWQPEAFAPLFSVLALDSTNAFAVGAFGTIKRTEDGGKRWQDIDAAEITGEKLHLNSITRLRDGRLLAAGERGLVGLSPDGLQWSKIPSSYEGSFFGALPLGDHGVVVFGMRGNVFVSAAPESGQWQKVETGTTASLFGGAVLNANSVVLVGADGTLLQVNADSTTAKVLQAKSVDRDHVLAAVLLTPDAGMLIAGDKGVSKVSVPTGTR